MMRMLRRVVFVVTIVIGALTSSWRSARANPVDLYGFGSRQIALAGAVGATVDDASANYYNPGGLVRGSDLRIDIGYRYAQPFVAINGQASDVDAARGFSLGLVAPGRIGPFRFAFGASIWLPDQRLTRLRAFAFETAHFALYDNNPQRLLFSANLAVQIIPGLYLGGGLSFMSRTRGTVNLKGSVAVSDPAASELVTSIDVDLVAVRYPQVGLQWQAMRNLALGVTYRHSFVLELDQRFRIDGNVGNPGMPPIIEGGYFDGRALANDLFQPWQLTFSVAAHLHRALNVSFDLTYARWSEFPQHASRFELAIDIGSFNDLVNLPAAKKYPAPGFRDVLTPRLGVEWRAHEGRRFAVDVRGGYAYEPTPVPTQFGGSNLLDNDKHTFALGIGLELDRMQNIVTRPWALDFHFALTHLTPREHAKVDAIDRVGDLRTTGEIIQCGITLRTRF